MSIRGHRVDKKVYGTQESFNLWHDEELIDWLDRNSECGFFEKLNSDGCGEVEISVETLKKAIKEVKLEDYRKEALETDIKWAEENGEDYILYDCF